MNNKTFETIQQTIVRLETILEVDKGLDEFEREELVHARALLVNVYENSKSSNTP